MSGIEPTAVEELERALQLVALRSAQAGAAQAHDIEAGDHVALRGDDKGRDVFAESGIALRDDEPADAHVLMKDRAAAEEGAIAHAHVAAEQAIVRDDDAVADLAIVPQVRAGHEEIAIAHDGGAVLRGAAMNRAMLANDIVLADFDPAAGGRVEPEILGRAANDGAVADECFSPDPHRALDHHMGAKHDFVAQNRLRPDDRKRPDFHVRAERSARLHDGGRVHLHNTPASRKLKYGARPSAGAPMMM